MQTSNEIEETKGYKIAITFKPFIGAGCTGHMEIVKGMAKAINHAIHNPQNNGAVFNKGYEDGKKWQKEKDSVIINQLLAALKNSQYYLETAINAIPTGAIRNILTSANISALTVIKKAETQTP